MTTHTTWTDERIDQLKALWASGKPASVIGADLGITTNAVIGKANRLALVRRPHTNPLTVRRAPPRPKPASPDTSRLCSLFELTANTCRWPLDGGYCGHHTAKTYCGFHAQMSYRPAA
jgi:GcrA cell cycle regulator